MSPGSNAYPGPTVLATRSRLFRDTIDVMGWNVQFERVRPGDVSEMCHTWRTYYLGQEVDRLLGDHGSDDR